MGQFQTFIITQPRISAFPPRNKGVGTPYEDVICNDRHIYLGATEVPILTTEVPVLSSGEYPPQKDPCLES